MSLPQITLKLASIQAPQPGRRMLTFTGSGHMNIQMTKEETDAFDMDTEYVLTFTPKPAEPAS